MKNEKVKKKQALKTARKLTRLHGKKKLKKHVVEAFTKIKVKRGERIQKKITNINQEWEEHNIEKNIDCDIDALPLDMLDDDMDWEGSAFAIHATREQDEDEIDLDNFESRLLFRDGEKYNNYRELLPIKIKGKLVERRIVEKEESDVEDSFVPQTSTQKTEDDTFGLSAVELLKKRKELLETIKIMISSCACTIVAEPEEQVRRLKELLLLCVGFDVHPLVRETVQKLALVSTLQVFIDIIPGYAIRVLSDAEMDSSFKKETKKLYFYEKALLRNYEKYLQLLEKNTTKLLLFKKRKPDTSSFSYKLAMVSLKCFCRLIKKVSHFNYSAEVIATIIKLSTCMIEEVVKECCETVEYVFRNDLVFRISAVGARCIASVVSQKYSVSPRLLTTFLKLNIKEVDKGEKNKMKEKLVNKKLKLAKERKSKSKNKYAKQLSKLEADLKEAEAAESLTTKSKYANETIKYVFVTYFRVLKRMPRTSFLDPVLEGISKFAHLLNVEFFDDIIEALELIVEQQHLSLLSSLHCIHAVFIILSGEGIAINIDPFRFYRSVYRLLCSLPFEKSYEVMKKQTALTLRTLEIMLIMRKKHVPLPRVVAFAKRLIDLSLFMPSSCTIAILAFIRMLFVAHPRCISLVVGAEIDCDGFFKPEVDDPDCCNALFTSFHIELEVLSRHSNRTVKLFSQHLRAGLPSTGNYCLDSRTSTRKPYDWLDTEVNGSLADQCPYFHVAILDFCKKEGLQMTSKNFQDILCKWSKFHLRK